MSRCQAFPPLGFVWNGVSGNDLIELLKVRKEKAEFEKEERREAKRMLKEEQRKAKRMLKEEQRKAKRMLKKSRKHDQIEEKNVHKDDHRNKKQKVRNEKAESEKEERRKAKKSRKHNQIEEKNMHKEDHQNKKQKTDDNIGHELQHTRKGNEVRTPKNNPSTKRLEAVQIELLQLRELFENIGLHEAEQSTELQLKEFFDNWAPPPITCKYLENEDEDLDWLLGARRDSTRQTAETSTTTASYPSSRMADIVYAMPYTMIV